MWKLIETKQGKVDIAKTHAAIYIIRNIVIRFLCLVCSVQSWKMCSFQFYIDDVPLPKILFCV